MLNFQGVALHVFQEVAGEFLAMLCEHIEVGEREWMDLFFRIINMNIRGFF